jgi:hypothetical protein
MHLLDQRKAANNELKLQTGGTFEWSMRKPAGRGATNLYISRPPAGWRASRALFGKSSGMDFASPC